MDTLRMEAESAGGAAQTAPEATVTQEMIDAALRGAAPPENEVQSETGAKQQGEGEVQGEAQKGEAQVTAEDEDVEALVARFEEDPDAQFTRAQLARISDYIRQRDGEAQDYETVVKARKEQAQKFAEAFAKVPQAFWTKFNAEVAQAQEEGRPAHPEVLARALQDTLAQAQAEAMAAASAPILAYATELVALVADDTPQNREFLASNPPPDQLLNAVANAFYQHGQENPDPKKFISIAEHERKLQEQADRLKPAVQATRVGEPGQASQSGFVEGMTAKDVAQAMAEGRINLAEELKRLGAR